MYGIPSEDDDEYYYDDEECWVMDNVMGEDCVEEADVEGMTYCWAYVEYNECTGEESCYAYVTIDGVDMEGDCDDLEGEHDDTWYSDDETWYSDDETWYSDDEECGLYEDEGDCMMYFAADNIESCYYYSSGDSCTGEESCFAYIVVDGVDVEGDCEELQAEYVSDNCENLDDYSETVDCTEEYGGIVESCVYTVTMDMCTYDQTCHMEIYYNNEFFEGACDELPE
jgi:hypothetical protein